MNQIPQYIKNQIEYYAIYFLKKRLEETNYDSFIPIAAFNCIVKLDKNSIHNQEICKIVENNKEPEIINDIPNSKELAEAMFNVTNNIYCDFKDEIMHIPNQEQKSKFLDNNVQDAIKLLKRAKSNLNRGKECDHLDILKLGFYL
jgi:hypothetical protein